MDMFQALAQEPYEHRGILHSEMAMVLYLAQRLGIERIIESGRARAQSTYMLAKYLPDVEIHSIEARGGADSEFGAARVRGFPNVFLHEGNGAEVLPGIACLGTKRTAVLCDGPKGAAAVAIVKKCFEYPHVRVGFIHDMRRLDHGGPSPHRAAAVEHLPNHRFTDDPAYAWASWMDAKVVEAGGPCGPQHEAVHGSYGPTLGAFFNPAISNKEFASCP